MRTSRTVVALALLSATLFAGLAEAKLTVRDTKKGFAAVAKEALPAVVFIDVQSSVEVPEYGYRVRPFRDQWGRRGGIAVPGVFPRKYLREGQGSGFIVSKDGYILTNNHVVKDAKKILVILGDGRKFEARLVGTDPKSEVAVIKIDVGEDLPYLEAGDSDALEVGEWVLAAGNPFGLTQSVCAGIVSAKGRDEVGIAEYANFIQTDAAINPGNSGGPLLDADGKVVGINTAIYSRTGGYMGIGFAIPINLAVRVKDQLLADGKVSGSRLGVYVQPLDEALAESFGLTNRTGLLVAKVVKNSAAEEAGLLEGDVILEVDGKKPGRVCAFRNLIATTPPGTEFELSVFRDGTPIRILATTRPIDGGRAAEGRLGKMGLSVDVLDEALARKLGLDSGGVEITEVEPGSPAWLAGLRRGQIIVGANRRPVSDLQELRERLKSGPTKILLLVTDGRSSRFVVLAASD